MNTAVETVGLGDIDQYVVSVGAGKPLLICGGPQLGHTYMRTLDVLADAHELIYFDARGTGRTELGHPSKLTFADAVADLEGLRAGLGIERGRSWRRASVPPGPRLRPPMRARATATT
jgi:pimeloyl-ACP methyl ester carboxylesterase